MEASTSSTMTTIAVQQKFKKQKKADQQNVDRLSDLPDLALGAIVSFLPFKEAGRTCVLSKRWKGIWRFAMNNVERFDESVLYRPLPLTSSSSKRYVIRRRYFIAFVKNYVLSNPQKELNSFRFSFSNPNHFKLDVDRLISYAISKNVKDFDLDFSIKVWKKHRAHEHASSFELPEAFYQHVLIESLKLSACNLRVPYLSKLRGLKNLSLGWIELYPIDIQSLLINCELLESLALKKCRELGTIHIMLKNSSRLTSFVVDDCSSLGEMWLHIPTLRYFKYFGTLLSSFYLENLRDIEEADFDFGVETKYNYFGDEIVAILRHIDNLRVLTVCSYIIQVIVTAEDPPLFMPDLRHLTLKTELTDVELLGVAHLFRSCPNLESLTIRLEPAKCLKGCDKTYTFDCHKFWRINGIPIPCLQAKLREVRIEGYPGKSNHLAMLQYLLAKGGGLQRVTIVLPWMMKEKDKEGTKKLLLQLMFQGVNLHELDQGLRVHIDISMAEILHPARCHPASMQFVCNMTGSVTSTELIGDACRKWINQGGGTIVDEKSNQNVHFTIESHG